jgi:hypothetical protein
VPVEVEKKIRSFGEQEQLDKQVSCNDSSGSRRVLELGAGKDTFSDNPVRFWKPERIKAVFVKSEEDVAGWLCDSFLKSLVFKVINK